MGVKAIVKGSEMIEIDALGDEPSDIVYEDGHFLLLHRRSEGKHRSKDIVASVGGIQGDGGNRRVSKRRGRENDGGDETKRSNH